MGFVDQPIWPPMYKPVTYDAMVFTESGANGQHYYAVDSVGNLFCIDSPTACIQEAINYVLSKPTGGKVYIRAGDYYLAPFPGNPANAVVTATIPYNAALIVEGDGDATRIHLPQNSSSANSQAWLFSWGWNGTAPYTRKSKLRNIAFINDVNTGSYAMNVLVTSASTNESSGLEVDGVSVYDIQGTALYFTFWINNLYDVTFTRYRFFSINSNTPNMAVVFDSVALGKIVDSFIYTVNGGNSAISNGTGSIQVDSVEIYGGWSNAFNFGSTDSESNIDVTNSIIGIGKGGSQGIQGLNNTAYGPAYLIFNGGNGTVRFTITSSQLLTAISYNANGASNPAYIIAIGNLVNTGCAGYVVGISNPSTGYIYMDVSDNVLGMNYGYGSCGGSFIAPASGLYANSSGMPASSNTYNVDLVIKHNLVLDNGNVSQWVASPLPGMNIDIEDNDIFFFYGSRAQYIIQVGNNTSGGLVKLINNRFTWTSSPSSATSYYIVQQPYTGSGPYYLPNIIVKGNTFNYPTSNASFGGFITGSPAPANSNALFVDLDNSFNLSGINLPYPSISTPSVPSSGTAQQNTYPYPVEVYVSGGSATAVQVTRGGVTYTVWSSSTATTIPPLLVRLEPGDSITLTYSTAPSWTWVPAKYIR
jgi:hypothetical protein